MFFLWVLFTKEILLEAIFKVVTKLPPWMPMCQNCVKSGKVGKVGHQSEGPSQIQGLRRFMQQIVLFHFNSLSPTPRYTIGLKRDQVQKLGKLGHRSQDCEADPGFAETPAAAWSILVTIGHNAPSVASHEPTGKHWKYEKSKKSRNPEIHKISWFQKNSHMSRPISPDLSLHDDFSFKPGRNSSKLVSGFNGRLVLLGPFRTLGSAVGLAL